MQATPTRSLRCVMLVFWAVLSVPAAADYEAGLDASDVGDYTAAFNEFARAAAQGDLRAANSLGELYERGDGVERDPVRAAEWYRRAAESGNREAQYNLAGMYRSGDGVPLDPVLSMQWYRRAADQRLAIAQFFVGKNYEHGQGVEQDPAEAWAWYSLAAVSGDSGSAGNRDRVARFLSEQQRQRAVMLLRDHALDLALPPSTLRALGVTPPAGNASAAATASDTTAQDIVSAIQQALTDLGYDIGEIDGLAGPRTRDAISEFARSVGMEGDPRIGPLLLEQLHAARQARSVAAQELDAAATALTARAEQEEIEQSVADAALLPDENPARVTAVDAVSPREALREAPAASEEPPPSGAALIRSVQSRLEELGYEPGPVDGLVGSRTRRAAREFRADRNLPGDMQVDALLFRQLNAVQRASAPPVSVQAALMPTILALVPDPTESALVASTASADPPVREAQRLLAALGFDVGEADGVVGPRTRNAARAFEEAHGRAGDGRIDTALVARLRAAVESNQTGVNTDALREAQHALLLRGYRPGATDGQMASQTRTAIATFQRDEGLGASGELDPSTLARLRTTPPPPDVSVALLRDVQSVLVERGYDPGPIDGAMGPRTRAAIAAFRRAEGLPEDGALDTALLRRLDLTQGN